jgi:hypothetical protein
MTKYLVMADIYPYGYGSEVVLFGIFNTKEEAIQWIISNPIQKTDYEESFDFFETYEAQKEVTIYEEHQDSKPIRSRKVAIGTKILSKEEYAERYIKEFDGSPLLVGFYAE